MAERYLSGEEPALPDIRTFEGYEGQYVMDALAVYAYRASMRAYMNKRSPGFDRSDVEVMGLHYAARQREETLKLWRAMCEAAPGAVIGGKKGLFLSEEALVRFGSELED